MESGKSMKIGLVRHFKVNHPYPTKRVERIELQQWLKGYDEADIEKKDIDLLGIEWTCCFVSDLPRALTTAKSIYNGELFVRPELREIPMSPFLKTGIKLSVKIHAIIMRLAWLCNHSSQTEKKAEMKKRVTTVVNEILAEKRENILVVSHGALMVYLRKELLKRGFKGEKFTRAHNARVYLYEKEE
ncbi:histidine phosphatase family protein [Priestia filamentosa]|nr:histidine phosphatase family protein [Priestia filamentosa]